MRWECYLDPSVTAFASNTSTFYAGLATGGKVLSSADGSGWRDYLAVNDDQVRSLTVWSGNLFIGTSPNGQIWVKNLSTGTLALSLETFDESVTGFAEYDGYLYAGTAPMGYLYRFDGANWVQDFQTGNGGVSVLVTDGAALYVFLRNAATGLVFDGAWLALPIAIPAPPAELTLGYLDESAPGIPVESASLSSSYSSSSSSVLKAAGASIKSGDQTPTLASFRRVITEPTTASHLFIRRDTLGAPATAVAAGLLTEEDRLTVRPLQPDEMVLAAVYDGTNILIGTGNGRLLSYSKNDKSLTQLYQSASGPVSLILPLGVDAFVFVAGSTVYFSGAFSGA